MKKELTIFLILIMMTSIFSISTKREVKKYVNLIVKFNNYEIYNETVAVKKNDTIASAVGKIYYVKTNPFCIRNACNNNESRWIIYNEYGQEISENSTINGSIYYLIYNTTEINTLDVLKKMLGYN